MTDVYLRDLNESVQADFIRVWTRKGRTDLLKAKEEGEDIKVGEYVLNNKEEVV